MPVSERVILDKMLDEMNGAIQQQPGPAMVKHIEHIRLLCDLLLEEKSDEKPAKMEHTGLPRQIQQTGSQSDLAEEGDSIFDF